MIFNNVYTVRVGVCCAHLANYTRRRNRTCAPVFCCGQNVKGTKAAEEEKKKNTFTMTRAQRFFVSVLLKVFIVINPYILLQSAIRVFYNNNNNLL